MSNNEALVQVKKRVHRRNKMMVGDGGRGRRSVGNDKGKQNGGKTTVGREGSMCSTARGIMLTC